MFRLSTFLLLKHKKWPDNIQPEQLTPLLISHEVLLFQCGQHVLKIIITLRMRKRLLYSMHRMISWPLCWSPMKFSFFSVVNMCYKIRLYCACARGCFTMRTEWSAGPSAGPPWSSPSSMWSTCATKQDYTAHAQEVAVQYAQNDQLAPLQVSQKVLFLQCGQNKLQSKLILRMRKRLLYNVHRMISWPLCWSASKFSFFSVVNMCSKL